MDERQVNALMTRLAEMLQGVRQYIGARYVPHFLDDPWNDTTEYEALDVVDNGMGTSYIAKKPVPAGTPLSDREFWFVYGSTSGAIINLQNQIDAIVNTTLPGINSEIEALTTKTNKIDSWKNRKVLFVSDSYGTQGTNWCDRCAQKLGITDYANLSVSGEGFTTGVDGNGFKNQLVTYSGNRGDVDFIIIGGGLNDSTFNNAAGATTLSAAIADFFTYAKANYPNAKYALSYIGNALDNSSVLSGRTIEKRKWAEFVYKNGATENGAIYCDIVNCIKTNVAYMASDGVHPATGGGVQLGYYYASFLLGDYFNVQYPRISLNPTYTTYSKMYGDVKYEVINPLILLNVVTLALAVPGNTTINKLSDIQIFTFNDIFFNEAIVVNTIARLDNFDGINYQTIPIKLTFTGNEAKVTFMDVNGASAGSHTSGGSGGSIIIYDMDIKIPLEIMG